MTATRNRTQLWRAAAVTVFCVLPLVLIWGSISNVMEAVQAADQSARRNATTSAIVVQLERRRARTIKPVDTATLYLSSASESLARAEIQDRATKLVSQAGGRLAEVQLTTTPEQEAAGTVALQLSLDIDNKGLLDLLYAIESNLPLLDVTDLSAQRKNGQNESATDNIGALRVDLTVRAHWRKSTG